jgi:hypothetical protein
VCVRVCLYTLFPPTPAPGLPRPAIAMTNSVRRLSVNRRSALPFGLPSENRQGTRPSPSAGRHRLTHPTEATDPQFSLPVVSVIDHSRSTDDRHGLRFSIEIIYSLLLQVDSEAIIESESASLRFIQMPQ